MLWSAIAISSSGSTIATWLSSAFYFLKIFSSIAETGLLPQQSVLTIPAN